MAQLSPKAATLVANFLALPPADQTIVFNMLSKHQPPAAMFNPYPSIFATSSPPSPPPSTTTYRTSVPFVTSLPLEREKERSVWADSEVVEKVVKEAPVVTPMSIKRNGKREKKAIRKEEFQPEPITDNCVQVCDQEGCPCRYKTKKTIDYTPDLVENGIYIFLGQQHQEISRKEGESAEDRSHRVSSILYSRIAKALPFEISKGQLYVKKNRRGADLTLDTHEDAVKAYVHLRNQGFKVNWMRARQRRSSDDSREEEEEENNE